MTPLQLFVEKWTPCVRCGLSQTRTRIVLGKGCVPCDVLFIGKAPGMSEDTLGEPFSGPDGKLLDRIVAEAVPDNLRCGYTNLVCCLPRHCGVIDDPEPEEVRACRTRLTEFVSLCRPKLIVMVGKVAAEWLDPHWKDGIKFDEYVPMVEIIHPVSIVSQSVVSQGLMLRRCVIAIRDAVEKFVLAPTDLDDCCQQ